LDNVAPKVIGILGLGPACDIDALRRDLIEECLEYTETLKTKKQAKGDIEEMMEDVDGDDQQQRAFMAPNPGSSANLTSRKQRMIFVKMDRTSPYSVLDSGKVVDMVVVVMSCKNTNVHKLKEDTWKNLNAIDEVGYKALSLLRSQGMVSLIGVL